MGCIGNDGLGGKISLQSTSFDSKVMASKSSCSLLNNFCFKSVIKSDNHPFLGSFSGIIIDVAVKIDTRCDG